MERVASHSLIVDRHLTLVSETLELVELESARLKDLGLDSMLVGLVESIVELIVACQSFF